MANPNLTGHQEKLIFQTVGAGTAITATTETAFSQTVTIDADKLAAGDIIRVYVSAIQATGATAGTNILRLRLTNAAGTLLSAVGTFIPIVSTTNKISGFFELIVRSIGATGSFWSVRAEANLGQANSHADASDNTVAAATVDTTANMVLVPTIEQSQAHTFTPQAVLCSIAKLGL